VSFWRFLGSGVGIFTVPSPARACASYKPGKQECKNAKEGDKASAVDSNNAHGLGSKQMSDMEARRADC
jgi:hypothetical protein